MGTSDEVILDIGTDCNIDKSVIIEPGVIIGDGVTIMRGCYIGYGCTIGDNCLIGEGVNIRDKSFIGNDVVVLAKTTVVKSTICDLAILGKGSVLLKAMVPSSDYVPAYTKSKFSKGTNSSTFKYWCMSAWYTLNPRALTRDLEL